MRINAHAHIFNLQTVLTREAIEIIARRIRDRGVPEFVVGAVSRILDRQLDRPEYLVEEELLERFIAEIAADQNFQGFIASATSPLPVEITVLGGGVQGLGVSALRASLDKLSTYLDARDGSGGGIFDVFETLRLAMQPDIVGVADRLLEHLRPDDALVALMMDITSEQEPERDRRNFELQLRGTMEAAVQRPGRIFPFVAINPRRSAYLDILRRAVEEMGFCGVKLYPSLGYAVDTSAMRKVYDYCIREDIPLLVHCTDGGFYRDAGAIANSDPDKWYPVLDDYPELRLCFGHCGGWRGLVGGGPPAPDSWAEEVVGYIRSFPNVCADLSYHVDMMAGGALETDYFATLHALLADPTVAGRILFGTDAWLVRLNITDAHYWKYFERHLTADEFRQITEEAPRRFLGLPAAAGTGARPNIERHLAFLASQSDRVGAEPSAWVRAALPGVAFTPRTHDPFWTPNNQSHFYTFRYLRDLMTPSHQQLGFSRCGALRLRQLTYWQKEHEAAVLFAQRTEANARRLAAFCKANGATYEGSYDDDSAVTRLAELFADGDRTLADMAQSVDAIFRFHAEVV
ncbi:MAG TPA: amidohydrolase family protein [Gemmatimonadaceae bacterium]|nr:amidohydrolase family protein [Gemmatimonadaceae bacterium]